MFSRGKPRAFALTSRVLHVQYPIPRESRPAGVLNGPATSFLHTRESADEEEKRSEVVAKRPPSAPAVKSDFKSGYTVIIMRALW